MKLLIHDLNEEEWLTIADQYEDYEIIADEGTIKPCIGCFSCWNRTPGKCVIKDGYENMGCLIHHAEEVKVISRYTYGGFSSFVKNVFDRCLGYVLPHFELVNGESHHMKRYDETKPITFVFYGDELSEEDRQQAIRYVNAVCINMRAEVKDVIFEEKKQRKAYRDNAPEMSGKVALLNASMRSFDGNSAALLELLKTKIQREVEIVKLSEYLNEINRLVKYLEDYETIVLGMPLYVDGLPSQLIRLLEEFERFYMAKSKKIYVLANMGLYESGQLINQFAQVQNWCRQMNFAYMGSVGIGAGEMVGVLLRVNSGIVKPLLSRITKAIEKLAIAIDHNEKIDDVFTGVNLVPRFLYMAIANSGWKRMAKANGLEEKDLYTRL